MTPQQKNARIIEEADPYAVRAQLREQRDAYRRALVEYVEHVAVEAGTHLLSDDALGGFTPDVAVVLREARDQAHR